MMGLDTPLKVNMIEKEMILISRPVSFPVPEANINQSMVFF